MRTAIFGAAVLVASAWSMPVVAQETVNDRLWLDRAMV